jgi:signal peptide peptidase SppA
MNDAHLDSLWAISPARLTILQALHETHLRDAVEQFASPPSAVQARAGGAVRDMRPQRYGIRDGVALLALRGVLAAHASWLDAVVETSALDAFARDVRIAATDPQVRAVLVLLDSPGGSVAGTQVAAQALRALRGMKPVGAFVEDAAASAGYWIGSAVDPGSVWIASDTTQVGAIGVVALHRDLSGREQQLGVRTTEVVAGKFKRIASEHRPLDAAGREALQAQVDHVYAAFVQDVAAHRGVPVQRVLDSMADGRTFLGQQAIRAGLADGMTTLEGAIAQLAARARGGAAAAPAPAPRAPARTISPPSTPAPRRADIQSTPTLAASAPLAASPTRHPTGPTRIDPTDSTAVDSAARAYQFKHPGTEYITAARAVTGAGAINAPKGFAAEPGSAALDAAARAWQAQHPGCDYITAVKTVQRAQAQQVVDQ